MVKVYKGAKSKSDTAIDNIELAKGKYLYSENEFVDTSDTSRLMRSNYRSD